MAWSLLRHIGIAINLCNGLGRRQQAVTDGDNTKTAMSQSLFTLTRPVSLCAFRLS